MRAELWWTEDSSQASAAVEALANDLANGGSLPEIEAAGLPLARNELLHASVAATCSWYGPADVTYDTRQLLMFGSTTWLGITAAASALGNRRRHAAAAALASPQWRPLRNTWVLLTNERIVVPYGDSLLSLWIEDIAELRRHPDAHQLELISHDNLALLMRGVWVHYLAVGLAHLRSNPSVGANAGAAAELATATASGQAPLQLLEGTGRRCGALVSRCTRDRVGTCPPRAPAASPQSRTDHV